MRQQKFYLLKNLCAIVIPVVLMVLISLCGCSNTSRDEDPSSSTPTEDSLPPNTRAIRMKSEGRPFEEYMKVQMKAVDQLRKGKPQSDAILILSQTGHLLMRHGDYIDALEYLQEASDSSRNRRKHGVTDPASVMMHNNLAAVYVRFGLFEESLAENAFAIEVSEKEAIRFIVDLWRMRGAIYSTFMTGSDNRRELGDSVLYCLQKAYEYIPRMKPDIQRRHESSCNHDKAALFVEHHGIYPDSVDAALKLLNYYPGDESHNNSIRTLRGRALVLKGRNEEGIALMEEALEEFRKQNWKECEEWALRLLAQSYAEAGRGGKLASIYKEVASAEEELMNQTKVNVFVGADFKYRLREKQHEVDSLKNENERSGKIIVFGGALLVLGLLAGSLNAVSYIKLKSKSREEKERHKKEISGILSQQVTLNNRIEQLNLELQKKENDIVIDRVVEQINPELLSGEEETKFRRAFMSLYPNFLKKLRHDYPVLTSSDELLCMLIYLKVPSIDMAASLGISRPSLNSARYRLRKRLNLDKYTDLDGFLQSM